VSLLAFARDDVWALGVVWPQYLLHHFDGVSWTKVEQTWNAASNSRLSGTSSRDLWVGGYGFAHHFDGETWKSHAASIVTQIATVGGETYGLGAGSRFVRLDRDGQDVALTTAARQPSLAGVWAAANDDVWAVGTEGTVLHYDGSRIEKLASGTSKSLRAVWGTRSDDVWIAGAAGTLLHWQGDRLEAVASGTEENLSAVYGAPNASEVWIGGTAVLLRATAEGVTKVPLANLNAPKGLAWGGSEPVTKKEIVDMHGSSSDYIWAVLIGTGPTEYNHAYIARYDGTWHPVENHGFFDMPPKHVWVRGRDDVWVMRDPSNQRFPKWYGHWDGKTWTDHPESTRPGSWLFALPEIPYGGAYNNFVFGEDDIWAVGFEGFWVHSASAQRSASRGTPN